MRELIRGVHYAQITDIHPETYEVSVIMADLSHAEGVKVKLTGRRQHPVAGDFQMPEPFDWGIVVFAVDDIQAGYWLGSISDLHRHLIPTELFTSDPHASLVHHPGDQYVIEHGDGSSEHLWPDGTMLKTTTRKDGTVSNTGARSARTERYRTLSPSYGKKGERKPYTPRQQPPVDVVLEHSSGAKVTITADGSFACSTPKGHNIKIHDGTEKVRSSDYPHGVTSTPEESANRVNSGLYISTEMGHQLELNDDPVNGLVRYVKLKDASGHQLLLHDDPNAGVNAYVELKTNAGHKLELRDKVAKTVTLTSKNGHKLFIDDDNAKLELSSVGGRKVTLDDTSAKTTITDPAQVIVDAPAVHLGGSGGKLVARLGDSISQATNKITGSASKVYAV